MDPLAWFSFRFAPPEGVFSYFMAPKAESVLSSLPGLRFFLFFPRIKSHDLGVSFEKRRELLLSTGFHGKNVPIVSSSFGERQSFAFGLT